MGWRARLATALIELADRIDPIEPVPPTVEEMWSWLDPIESASPTVPEMWSCNPFVVNNSDLPAGVRCDLVSDSGAQLVLLSINEALQMAQGLISSAEDANRYNLGIL